MAELFKTFDYAKFHQFPVVTKNNIIDDNNTYKEFFCGLVMIVKRDTASLLIHSYTCNKLYDNLVCLADDFIELKGGLNK